MSTVQDAVEMGLDALLRAVLQRLRSQFGSRLSDDELLAAARRAVDGIKLDASTTIAWETAPRCTIEQAQRVHRLRTGIRLVGTVAERSAPQILRVPDGESVREVEATCARIVDAEHSTIWSLDISGPVLLDKVHEAWRSSVAGEYLGIPIALPIELKGSKTSLAPDHARQNVFFALIDLRATTSVLDLVGATDAERAESDATLRELAASGTSPSEHIYRELVDVLLVVGLDRFPLLGLLIKFVVMQALSCGAIDHASARLHGIVVGPPGRGKKLLGLAARALNPLCEDMSPAKASPAGLVGASYSDSTGWHSSPGVLARASQGVVRLQDAHGWLPSLVRKLAPILQEVMEDGVVRDAVAGGVERPASAALLLDMNRNAHVGAAGESALLSVRPVLSRADLLAEIPPDSEQAWSVARSMIDRIGSRSASLESDPRVRALRVLVATLRDRHPQIDLDPARDHLAGVFDAIRAANADVIANEPEAGDLPARLVISLARYTTAAARGAGRSAADASDVEAALPFVQLKLKFLKMHRPVVVKRPTPGDFAARRAGEPVRSEDLAAEYAEETGEACSERTMRRHLRKAGASRVGPNLYLLPAATGTCGQPDTGADGAADTDEEEV